MIRLLTGDCRTILPTLADQSVYCCVTSPPYFGLRDYGTATWNGGDAECSHKPSAEWVKSQINGNSRLDGGFDNQAASATKRWLNPDGSCRCGAIRIDSQIGLEPTPQAYVEQLVAVFRGVRRVLRDDGTLWLNLGDSYASGTIGRNDTSPDALVRRAEKYGTGQGNGSLVGLSGNRQPVAGLKPKDLVGIPWRVAFALQADGWYLRQDIIWSKPNPMPESVTDRCTKAHEYMFLLSKKARYYYDADAIREEPTGRTDPIRHFGNGPHAVSHTPNYQLDGFIGRNKRSVWEIATQPYSEAHFATFPPALIEPCIKAGCPKDGTVLDPFGGAGTTGLVADRLGRNALLIELNPAYSAMGENRIRNDAPLFAELCLT